MSIDQDTSDASGSESVTTDFGRTLAELGLDVRFLSQNARGSEVSKPFSNRSPGMPKQSTPVEPPHDLQPPLSVLRTSLLKNARRDSVIARSDGPQSQPMRRHDAASRSVLTAIGPVAAAQRARDRSRDPKTRRLWSDARAAAQPIAITVALICMSVVVGAAVPLLLSLLGP